MATTTTIKRQPTAGQLAYRQRMHNEAQERRAIRSDVRVPIVDSSEVDALRAELDQERAHRQKLEAQIPQIGKPLMGRPQPEMAMDFVAPRDAVNALNEMITDEHRQRAIAQGKPNMATSSVTHNNEQTTANSFSTGKAKAVFLYDNSGLARRVPIDAAIVAGLWPTCPVCFRAGKGHQYHAETETNPNACPSRKPVAVVYCSICRMDGKVHPIYDMMEEDAPVEGNPVEDPNAVTIDIGTTAEDRLKIKLMTHIHYFHENTYASLQMKQGVGA